MPPGYEVLWEDTLTEQRRLILTMLGIPDPGTRLPDVRQATKKPVKAGASRFRSMIANNSVYSRAGRRMSDANFMLSRK